MNKTLYLDCSSGISGDMFVGALLDLGVDEQKLQEALKSLSVNGFEVKISRKKKAGLDGCDFDVIWMRSMRIMITIWNIFMDIHITMIIRTRKVTGIITIMVTIIMERDTVIIMNIEDFWTF